MRTETLTNVHTAALRKEMDWLTRLIEFRLALRDNREYSEADPLSKEWVKRLKMEQVAPQEIPESALGQYYLEHPGFEFADRVLVALGLAVHICPRAFAKILLYRERDEISLYEAGGIKSSQYDGFIPTGMTWLWLVSSGKTDEYARQLARLYKNHPVLESGIIRFSAWNDSEPSGSGAIMLDKDFLVKVLG
ncbi:MAG: AAA ATPase, central region [Bacteroidetes bacterium]|nr:MAG: AAA ATPase, central region [Bacteroidota bacterium]